MEIWPDQPAKAVQKDTDARWTVKFAKARPLPGGRPGIDIAIPSFGYKSSIAICRRYGFIRSAKVTDGARFDGRMLRDVVTRDNTASDVWADTAYRSQANEAWLKSMDRVSRVHRKKPRGKPMSRRASGANAKRSTVRARVEHVFARQKGQMGLFISHDRHCTRRSEDHARQPRLQYRPPDLPRTASRHGLAASGDGPFRLGRPKSRPQAVTTEQNAVFALRSAPCRHVNVGAHLASRAYPEVCVKLPIYNMPAMHRCAYNTWEEGMAAAR